MKMKWIAPFFVCLGLLFPAIGWACLPPLEPLQFLIGKGTPDGIPFSISGDLFEEPVVTVELNDEPIAGEVNALQDGRYFVFRPENPLEVGQYSVSINVGEEGIATDTEVLALGEVNLDIMTGTGIYESTRDVECCSTEVGGCFDSCGTCYSCWPTEYQYRRQLILHVETQQPVIISGRMMDSQRADRAILLLGRITFDLRSDDLESSETCAELIVSDLAENELERHEVCAGAAEFPSVERRLPDGAEAVSRCAEPPENTDDPNWKKHGKKSEGCSSVGSLTSLFLLLIAFGFRRRCL